MPYIHKDSRSEYDKEVLELTQKLISNGIEFGEINYVISSLIWNIFKRNPCYKMGNGLMGVLDCVKYEFYRRQISPYEDKKIEENGDL